MKKKIAWTPSQSAAIETHGHDIIVSAAAGSGKTAALTERIIRSLTRESNPTDMTRILAVTFTRAAAAELRRRISSALSERIAEEPGNKRLIRQLMLLGSAKICTIDSFCSDVVRAGFSSLPLPAGFRIPDDTELRLLKQSVMNDVIDAAFESDGTPFAELADSLAGGNKNDVQLPEVLCQTYNRLQGLPEGVEYLRHCYEALEAEQDMRFYDTRAGKVCATELLGQLDYYKTFLERAAEELDANEKTRKSYLPAFTADLEHCRRLIDAIEAGDYTAARSTALNYTPRSLGRLSSAEKTPRIEMLVSVRTAIRDELREGSKKKSSIQSRAFAQDSDEIRRGFARTASMLGAMYRVLKSFEQRLNEEKQLRALCDFDDIRRYAYSLLVAPDGTPTPLAHDYASRYDEVFIDEYQDVNEVQDKLFCAVSNGHNRFMVGDIKQSIYGFRGAEPSLFAKYRADFSRPESGGETIFMSENFRCDKSVIDFVNLVCGRIFPACGESIGYTREDDLVFGKGAPEGFLPEQVSVVVLTAPEDKDSAAPDGETVMQSDAAAPDAPRGEVSAPDKAESHTAPDKTENHTPAADAQSDDEEDMQSEVAYVAATISELLRSGRLDNGKRVSPADIAVLCRTKSACAAVAERLTALSIPVNSDSARGYYTRPEVSLMISLLTVIDNPQRDVQTAAVLRSPLFGFSMDELSRIRKSADKKSSLYDAVTLYSSKDDPLAAKCRGFTERLEGYRGMARVLSADRLLRGLYRDTSIIALCREAAARADLERLYEYARQFEAGSFRGLYNFIKYVNQAIAEGDNGDVAPAEPGAAAVTILTIHHSKGLEFPVCIVCGCGGNFNLRDTQNAFVFSRTIGPGIRLKDTTGLASLRTPLHTAAALDACRLQLEEEMRLLYVALTRARERLIVTASCRRGLSKKLLNAELYRETAHPYPLLHVKSSLDWLLDVLPLTPSADSCYRLELMPSDTIPRPLPYTPESLDGQSAECLSCPDEKQLERELESRFDFTYPFEHLTHLPAKLSVSKLYPGMLDEDTEDLSEPNAPAPKLGTMTFAPRFLTDTSENSPSDNSTPACEKPCHTPANRITSAERGTATHVFLQFCDFDSCISHGVRHELKRLCERGFIPAHMAEIVDIGQLEAFFASELFASLRTAREVHREQRFNIMLPASAFSSDPSTASTLDGEKLLVQGVIDLFFTDADGRLILCDYKTDRLTPAQLADPALAAAMLSERHRTQLSYYSAALARICSRRPDRVVIYSLPLGKTVDVETDLI